MPKGYKASVRPFGSSRAIFFALIAAFVLALCSHNSSTAQTRIIKSFDADWRFFKGDAVGAEISGFDDSSWRKLDVPHDWSIEGPFDAKNATGGAGGFLPSGVAWYRKHFAVPATERSRRVYIDFDGVMGITDVWINGFHLGTRPYG